MTVRARDSEAPVVAQYTYTDDALLASAICGGGTTTVTNTWDAMGNRVGLSVNGASYSFTYNPLAGVPAVIEEAGPDKTYRYFRDPNGVLIARFDTDPLNEDPWRYYHYDELGSTRLLTDEDGEVTDEYAYDAYGNTITHLGTTQDNPYQWVGALGYYTHYQAPEFKLIQLGFRFYDPEIGRFTQQDPIGDGLNWYAYANGDPLSYVDPWGLAVGAPSWWEELIPVWGSGKAMVHDFQNGNWLSGAFNLGMVAADVATLGGVGRGVAIGRAVGRRLFSANWAWGNVRRHLGKMGFAGYREPVHHWIARRNGWLGKRLPDSIVNHPLNLMPGGNQLVHNAIHGVGKEPYGVLEQLWHGTPLWPKTGALSVLGGLINLPGGHADCECP